MPPLRNKQIPDPNASPERMQLLRHKSMLREVLKQIPEAIPTDEVRSNIGTLKNDLNVISKWIASRNKFKLAPFLHSVDALSMNIDTAVRELLVALNMIHTHQTGGLTMKEKADCVRELHSSLNNCRSSIKGALKQFRI